MTDREGDSLSTKSIFASRHHQLERLQKQVQSLEKTREQCVAFHVHGTIQNTCLVVYSLSAELVTAAQRANKAESNLADYVKMKTELSELQMRYSSAIELLGEREEQVDRYSGSAFIHLTHIRWRSSSRIWRILSRCIENRSPMSPNSFVQQNPNNDPFVAYGLSISFKVRALLDNQQSL